MSEIRENTEKNSEEIQEIDILNVVAAFWNGFRRLWPLLAVIIAVCTLRSYLSTSFSYKPKYVASATVSVTTPGGMHADISSAQEMASIFPYILTSGVLQDVIENDLGLTYLPGKIDVSAEEDMNMMTISVSSDDPQMAYNILMSVIENYPEVSEYIFGETRLQILDETGIPSDTQKEVVIRGSYKKGILQGAVISAVILCLYVFIKRTVRTKDQVKKQINIQDLGSFPYIRQKKRKKQENNTINILDERISPSYEEAVRRLRIRLAREMELKKAQVLLVTSSVPGEGKTTVAVNIALALAKHKKSVILIDCDLRNPSAAQIMHEEKEHPGLAAVLREKIPWQHAFTPVESAQGDLKIMYGGRPGTEDAALLGSGQMGELIRKLRRQADYIILDTAPAELLADASLLAKHADAALYVIRQDYTKMNRIRSGIEALSMRKLNILGFVFNGDTQMKDGRYGYGYGRYGRYGRYNHYSRYGKFRNTGKQEDPDGRVMKE